MCKEVLGWSTQALKFKSKERKLLNISPRRVLSNFCYRIFWWLENYLYIATVINDLHPCTTNCEMTGPIGRLGTTSGQCYGGHIVLKYARWWDIITLTDEKISRPYRISRHYLWGRLIQLPMMTWCIFAVCYFSHRYNYMLPYNLETSAATIVSVNSV